MFHRSWVSGEQWQGLDFAPLISPSLCRSQSQTHCYFRPAFGNILHRPWFSLLKNARNDKHNDSKLTNQPQRDGRDVHTYAKNDNTLGASADSDLRQQLDSEPRQYRKERGWVAIATDQTRVLYRRKQTGDPIKTMFPLLCSCFRLFPL